MALLEITDLQAGYARGTVIRGATLHVEAGEVVLLLGPNGAGKTTLLRAVSGMCRVASGEITLRGESLRGRPPHQIVRLGVGHVAEGRQLFADMTVWENLALGVQGRDARLVRRERFEFVLGLFPILGSRSKQRAGTLSGGEQQMLAIGRALMAEPAILLLDEPSTGLAPVVFETVIATVNEITARDTSILLVEQSIPHTLGQDASGYILRDGKIAWHGKVADIGQSDMAHHYLGAT